MFLNLPGCGLSRCGRIPSLATALLLLTCQGSFSLTASEVKRCDDVSALSTELVGVVLFGEGSSSLRGSMPKIGNAIGDVLAERSPVLSWKVYLVGHTDKVGSDRTNESLGKERAETVRKLLVDMVTAPFEVATCGETRPLLNTKDGRPHPHNRRVEVRVGD
ncbi:MAG: OmpA family protein [Mesorhizobium sp.]|uniref:OmpA family protein n=1 Tax=Mesorhizobium sp. TaxID=1871066 RepID=UPI000FE569AE|nr:MAG: OmpA family protein [Mesorhizobium sp.]